MSLITLIVYIVVLCLVVALAFYVLDAFPPPEPLNRFARVAIVVVACLILILILLQLAGVGTLDLKIGR